MGFYDNTGKSVSYSYRFDPRSRKQDEARLVTHCQGGWGRLRSRLAHLILLWAQGNLLISTLRAVYIPGHKNKGHKNRHLVKAGVETRGMEAPP